MKRHVIIFQQRFAVAVECGEKAQTIRPVRKRAICSGDMLDLREWTGKPYRSKQRKLREATCTSVVPFKLSLTKDHYFFFVAGNLLFSPAAHLLARRDGFGCGQDMAEWFDKTHGLPFEGVLIQWEPQLLPISFPS